MRNRIAKGADIATLVIGVSVPLAIVAPLCVAYGAAHSVAGRIIREKMKIGDNRA